MIITKLELENIRSYKKQEIILNSGITSLSGDIGSGKTSILQAIEFALFGFKKGDLEAEQLLRKGEKKGSVSLSLTNNNTNITIYREIQKTKTSFSQENSFIKINQDILELAPTELNYKIFELLNFPTEFLTKDKNLIYRFTIYTPQEQLKEILYAQQDKRLEVLRKLFSIDKYKQLKTAIDIYLKNIKEEKNIISAKLEPIENNISSIKEKLNSNKDLLLSKKNLDTKIQPLKEKEKNYLDNLNQTNQTKEQLYEIQIKLEKQLSQILELKKRKKEIEDELLEINTLKQEFEKINFKEKIQETQKQIISLKTNQENLKILINEKKDFFDKNKQIKEKQIELKQEISIIENELKHIDTVLIECKIEDKKVELRNLQKEIKKQLKLSQEKEEIKQKIEELNLKLNYIVEEKKNNNNFLSQIITINNCPTCRQNITQEYKNIIKDNFSQTIEKNNQEEEKIKLELDKFKIRLRSLEINLDKLNQNQVKNLSIEEQIKELEKKFETDTKTKQLYLKKLEEKKTQFLEISNENNLDIIQKEIEEINLNLNNTNQTLIKLSFNIEKLEEKEKNYLEKINKETKIIEKIEKINKTLQLEEQLNLKNQALKQKQININSKIDLLKSNIEKIRKEINDINLELNSINTKLEFQEKLQKELEILLKNKENLFLNIENLEKQKNLLTNHISTLALEIEKNVFTKFYIEFTEQFEFIFKQLIEDNEIDVRLDPEFSIIVEQNGYDTSIKNLSGGEKSSLAIAYRLALKDIINKNISNSNSLNILILDEPTDGFSQEQIERLGNLLKENQVEQIILVSHDKKIESIADNVLFVYKQNHISVIEK